MCGRLEMYLIMITSTFQALVMVYWDINKLLHI